MPYVSQKRSTMNEGIDSSRVHLATIAWNPPAAPHPDFRPEQAKGAEGGGKQHAVGQGP